MKTVEAFAPAHITGLFQICDKPADPTHKGSRGAGVSIQRGVKTSVTVQDAVEKRVVVTINGHRAPHAKVSETVAKEFLSKVEETVDLTVDHVVEVPIGGGFGSSGAAALSLAQALNIALDLKLTSWEAAQIAHTAEIKCKTGLGTVIAQTFGGFEIRTAPGAPGIGRIQLVQLSREYSVACLNLGNLSTQKALSNRQLRRRINIWGKKLLQALIEEPTAECFLKLSRKFAEKTGILTGKVRHVLDDSDSLNIVCSMPIFGEGAFSIVKKDDLESLLKVFQKYGSSNNIVVSEIDYEGARIL